MSNSLESSFTKKFGLTVAMIGSKEAMSISSLKFTSFNVSS